MSTTINRCSYDPKGQKAFQPIAQTGRLQKSGDLDISYLVNEIVSKDFGYAGKSKFNLVLRNNKMVLELWDTPDGLRRHKFDTLKLADGQWTSKKGRVLNLTHTSTSSRYAHTLDRIRNAYTPDPGPSHLKGKEEAASVEARNSGVEELLDTMRRRLGELERKVERHDEPRVDELRKAIDSLNERIEGLQRELFDLRRENHGLKDLKAPLERLAHDVPQSLREINGSLQEIKVILERMARIPSEGAHALLKEDVRTEITRIKTNGKELAEQVSALQKENEDLRAENASLKEQLSLKDKKITDLKRERDLLEKTATTYKQRNEELMDELEALRAIPVQDEATLEELRQENSRLFDGAMLAKKVVEKDAKRIKKLETEQSAAQAEIDRLKAQLEDARKTDLVAQRTITDLGMTVEHQNGEIEASRQAEKETHLALEKTKQVAFTLRNELEAAKEQHKEDELNLAYMEEQRSRSARDAAKARLEFKDLNKQYAEMKRVSDEIEQELLQQKESNEISDSLYKKQNEELMRRLKELEAEKLSLHDRLILKERSLKKIAEEQPSAVSKPIVFDMREKPKMTDVVFEQANELVVQLQKMSKDQTYPAERLGSILVNYALLENVSLDSLEEWIQGKQKQFPENIQGKHDVIRNQLKTQSHPTPPKNIASANIQFEKLMGAINSLPAPVTLQSIFGLKKAFVVQELLKYERTVGPLLKSDKGKQIDEVEKARKLFDVVQTLKTTLLDALRQTTWVKN